ncbi:methyltransferase [Lonsdalea britannica]|uniref:DNA cytosine methyltransferase n=1 Tax=Lonsdalea britannica TaxID=1082704 RepID=UPI000A1E19CB|nr:DNA cytosine methyltransferase [Lonsdalea britannica]OSN02949.1 methyltransferase [Lonsdalea britannica]
MSALAYYNEIDPFAAQWLRNLIEQGLIAPGIVDERSILDVTPSDLEGFKQCHFFAGIGGWSYALRQAGWPDDKPVWTGSCPCQPFSSAGAGDGLSDPRHLWPVFGRLIAECRPTTVFGEQVASKVVEHWIDLVQDDLETVGYAFGAVAFPAAGVGAPHIRDRTYWVAYADDHRQQPSKRERESHQTNITRDHVGRCCPPVGMADADRVQQRQGRIGGSGHEHVPGRREQGTAADAGFCSAMRTLQVNGFWRDADWLGCQDGKWRPVEPGSFPLANGFSGRVGCLRGYGNAIVPQAAAEFIGAFLDGYGEAL